MVHSLDVIKFVYVLKDAFKPGWVEDVYGERNTKHLYNCRREFGDNQYFNCVNDKNDVIDKEFIKFQERLENSKSREDLEEFFDVETYLKWQVLKYLIGSWDHAANYHNTFFYMFHDNDKDKWIPLLYDFDSDLGAYKDPIPHRTFEKEIFEKDHPIFQLLNIRDSNEEIIKIMEEMVSKVFNPNKLFPRIDQLKKFLNDHVKEDRTPLNGKLPGRMPRKEYKIEDDFTHKNFLENTVYNTIKITKYSSDDVVFTTDKIFGLKHWIIERFRYACDYYKFNCTYADKYLKQTYIVRTRYLEERLGGCLGTGYNCCTVPAKGVFYDEDGVWGIEDDEYCIINMKGKCWATSLGQDCCENPETKYDYHDSNINKFYGTENGKRCGILEKYICELSDMYQCCPHCNVEEVDNDGIRWGTSEDGNYYCVIPNHCPY
eukprot:jgi/Orpsp1_1/1178318/evm.model.c7180000064823.1